MKKILKFPIFILAFALAIVSAFAFSMPTSHTGNNLGTEYYFDPGAANTYIELKNPANWLVSGTICNTGGSDVCTINYTGTRAQFDAHVTNDFANKSQFLMASDSQRN